MLGLARRTTSLPLELVEWPEQRALRRALANAGIPRLLLVATDLDSPPPVGVDEHWTWANATDEEVDACAQLVLARVAQGPIERIDEGRWTCFGHDVRFTPVADRLFAELIATRGRAVSYERLMAAGWPGRATSRRALTMGIQRIREQLIGTGLFIRSLRGVGFLLV